MKQSLIPVAGIAFTAILTTSCFFSGKRSRDGGVSDSTDKANKKGADQVAWNAFGDPNWKSDVNGSIDRARQKAGGYNGGPRRNPDLRLPPVDPSLARSVSYSKVSGVAGPFLAMTFDDGPHPTLTPRLLDILKERNIKATFFVVGTNAKRYPQIIQRMIAEGHEVANHTVNHPINITRLTDEKVRAEFLGCEASIVAACGRKPLVMRPPGGNISSAQKVWINQEFGYKTILWSCDPEDWKRPGVSVVSQRIIGGAKNGAIILAHDIHAPTIAAVPAAMDGILAKGYRFVTVSQLISMEQQVPGVAAAPNEALNGPLLPVTEAEPAPTVRKVFSSIPFPQPLSFDSVPSTPAAVVEPPTTRTRPEGSIPEPTANPG
jgi:peptidoglycan/xylan/chitin deacetylase (PgdA/CDA1 family)